MAFRVEVSPKARRDADAILGWLLSHRAGEAGLRWFRKLEEAIASLSNFPERRRRSFRAAAVALGHKPHVYRILFTIDGETVYVLRIRHGRRKHLALQ